MPQVVIIGGGISGLSAAYRLTKLRPDVKVTVLESNARIGGNIVTEHLPFAGERFLIEGAADSFLSRKPRGIALCTELGLLARLQGRDPRFEKTYVKFGGQLHPLPSGLTGMIPTNLQAMNHSTLLSAQGRARLAQEVDLPAMPGDEDESLASFVTRRLGQEAYERMVEPLMSGIYAGDGTQLSLAATFPQLRQLEKKYGSLIKGLTASSTTPNRESTPAQYPPFVALAGGTGELLQRLAEAIGKDHIHLGVTVTSIQQRRERKGYTVEFGDGSMLQTDGIILTTPAYVIAQLIQSIDNDLALLHESTPYSSAATVSLGYRKEASDETFNGYGYVIPQVEEQDVLACSWMSNKWIGRAPEGYHLARVYVGRFGNPIAEEASVEELTALAIHELGETLGIDRPPEFARIYRWPRSMPQYVIGHGERIAQIEGRVAEIAGLEVAGAAYHGVGIPDCIAAGEAAAARIAQYVGK